MAIGVCTGSHGYWCVQGPMFIGVYRVPCSLVCIQDPWLSNFATFTGTTNGHTIVPPMKRHVKNTQNEVPKGYTHQYHHNLLLDIILPTSHPHMVIKSQQNTHTKTADNNTPSPTDVKHKIHHCYKGSTSQGFYINLNGFPHELQ